MLKTVFKSVFSIWKQFEILGLSFKTTLLESAPVPVVSPSIEAVASVPRRGLNWLQATLELHYAAYVAKYVEFERKSYCAIKQSAL